MEAQDILIQEIEKLREENARLKEQIDNRRVWLCIEKSSFYGDYLMNIAKVVSDYSRAIAWKENREAEMNTKKTLEMPVLTQGSDDELDDYNQSLKDKVEGEKFLGCELIRFSIET